MSLAVTHFAVGATMTTLLLAARRPRSDHPRTLSVCGGLWAMAPDAGKLLNSVLLDAVHDGSLANLCWLHGAFDAADAGDAPLAGAAALGALAVVTLWDERRASAPTASADGASPSEPRPAD